MHRELSRCSRELGLCRESSGTGGALFGEKGRKLGQLATRPVSTCAFNPQSGGGGGGPSGRGIWNLAGAGLLIYLFVTGRLDWLVDAVLTLWCPNCGGEFEVFEFTLKEENRLCPYCSQPFKRNLIVVVGCTALFESTNTWLQAAIWWLSDFGGPTSYRKREGPSGVIVDVEAEVMDKDQQRQRFSHFVLVKTLSTLVYISYTKDRAGILRTGALQLLCNRQLGMAAWK